MKQTATTIQEQTHEETSGPKAARAHSPLQEPTRRHRPQSSLGATDRGSRLARARSQSRRDSSSKTKEPRRQAAQPESESRRGHLHECQPGDLSRGRGPDPSLCARPISVWFDREPMDPGFHHHPRLCDADGARGFVGAQHVGGQDGGRGGFWRPWDAGCRHDGPRRLGAIRRRLACWRHFFARLRDWQRARAKPSKQHSKGSRAASEER